MLVARSDAMVTVMPMAKARPAGIAEQAVLLNLYMKSKGLKANQLAKLSGVPNQAIYRFLDGGRAITQEMAKRLAPSLGIHPDDLRPDAPLRTTIKRRAVKAIDDMDDDLVRRLLPMLEAGSQVGEDS